MTRRVVAAPLVLGLVYGAMLAERLFELGLNRRNVRWLRERGARFVTKDGFGLILAAQFTLFLGILLEGLFAPWSAVGWWTLLAACLLVVSQAIRYWAITTLGRRWCIRIATLPGAPRILGGPYRLLPHPNYLAVAIEAIAFPLAFHAWITLAIGGVLNLVALSRRIGREERALRDNEPSREVGTRTE